MTPEGLSKLAPAWGVQTSYEDYDRNERTVPAATVRTILDAMGASSEGPPPPGAQVTTNPRDVDLSQAVSVRTEDGGIEPLNGGLPEDLPFGYHHLVRRDGSEQSLIVGPGSCYLPPDLRVWGWALQLYSLRSASSWGIGDLGDLRRFATWAAERGARAVLLNPLHAVIPVEGQQPSPYFPSSRCFRNPLYLRVDDVARPDLRDELAEIRRYGRDLNRKDTIDRGSIYSTKMQALERLWEQHDARAFEEWAADRDELLWSYATYAALAEAHGAGTSAWPPELDRPDTAEVERWREENLDRVRFHAWLQWLIEAQLAAASDHLSIINDLAIGVDPDGADAWLWKDSFASGVTVGAPPDEFNLNGQDWGLPPFDPWKLRAAGYEPFIQTIRSAFRHSGGIRIDHVMGLFRLFWIPQGSDPRSGTYVRYPHEDLLNIVALESQRAGAYVIGEDLGTVEDHVREEMAARQILSYRLLWFEEDPPADYPELALAAVSNHDLPTIAGLWTGRDAEIQEDLGQEVNRAGLEAQKQRLLAWLDVDDDAPLDEVIEKMHVLLAESNSAIVMATLEDVLSVVDRPNFPGTTEERANWSIPLPLSLEEIQKDPRVLRIAEILSSRDRMA